MTAPAGWRVVDVAVDDDGGRLRARLEDGGEVRLVELSAGLLAVLGRLPSRYDGAERPADPRLDEWGRLQP